MSVRGVGGAARVDGVLMRFSVAVLMATGMIVIVPMPVRGHRLLVVRAASMRDYLPLVLRRHGAPLAVHPTRVAVLVVLLLPDGHTMFDLIDDVPAGAEGLVPVTRARAHPHRHIPDGEVADAMDARCVLDTEAFNRLGDDALAFLHRERLKRLVLEVPYA